MTADEPFVHNIARVWVRGEGRNTIVQWECQCGWRPRGTQPIRCRPGQTPHSALRESHFNHVKARRKAETTKDTASADTMS